jgi:predicted DNA-binding transcriptional regulator AlpA
MNAHETACYIGVSDSKFAEMRKTGAFPIKSLPYRVCWDQRSVDEWLNSLSGLTKKIIDNQSNGGKEAEKAWIEAAQNWHG